MIKKEDKPAFITVLFATAKPFGGYVIQQTPY